MRWKMLLLVAIAATAMSGLLQFFGIEVWFLEVIARRGNRFLIMWSMALILVGLLLARSWSVRQRRNRSAETLVEIQDDAESHTVLCVVTLYLGLFLGLVELLFGQLRSGPVAAVAASLLLQWFYFSRRQAPIKPTVNS